MQFDIHGWPLPDIERPVIPGGKVGDQIKIKDRDGTVMWIGKIREIEPDGTGVVIDIDYGVTAGPEFAE